MSGEYSHLWLSHLHVRAVHVLRAAFFPGTARHTQCPAEGRCAAKPILSVVEGQSPHSRVEIASLHSQ
jgi:hypothetical protein